MADSNKSGKGDMNEIQGFAGLDLDDVKSAVGAVVGSSDDVAGAVRFVAEYGDDIVDFIQRLPELLSSTASALSEAADDVAGAAAFLTGSPGKGDGVKAVANVAGEALDTCRSELASAQKLLDSVSKQFAKLPIPDGGIGDRIGDAAERFDRVGDRLAEVATQLRKMGLSVDRAGHGLARTADKLEKGGQALGRFSS
ncbi:MAG: hypothetical protein OEZ14_07900 [Acidimicrobiia bacterium]|nr:hypothetical protein [Acidimicrobiia bacterium]MDH5520440.1 hypothetical protein [Acidimicrobiia bacterium]